MELAIFLKMLFDSSAYLVICGFIVSCFTEVSALPAGALLASLSAGACYLMREKTGFARRLPLLIALPGFIFAKTLGDMGLLAVLFFYLAYIEEKQIYMNDDDDFKSQFGKVFFACIFPCLFAAVSAQTEKLMGVLLPYMFVMVICGIGLLRILRHSKDVINSRAFKLSNLISIGAVCLMTLFFSSPVFLGAVGKVLFFLYDKVFLKVFAVVLFAAMKFLSLFSRLFALIFHREVKFYEKGDPAPAGGKDVSFEDEVIGEVPDFIVYAFFGLLIAAAVFLLVMGLRALAGKNRRFDRHSGYTMDRTPIELPKKERRNPFAKRDERETVRYEYRKFLGECLGRGLDLTQDQDTEEINLSAEEYFPKAPLWDFRRIYIKARYSGEEVSREDAKNAKELFSEIKKTPLPEDLKKHLREKKK